jgi:hypothetical protein
MRFEDMRYGILKPVIATFYHWSAVSERDDPKTITLDSLRNDKVFYVSDDVYTWAAPHLDDVELYEVDVRVVKPFPLFEQMTPIELMTELTPKMLEQGGFDSVVYTPHPFGRGTRELCLLKPKDQVLAIRRVNNVYADMIARNRDLMHHAWDYLRRQPEFIGMKSFRDFMNKLTDVTTKG